MKKLILILFFIPATAYGQVKVQYSPMSMEFWGITPSTQMMSVQYGPIGIIHLHADAPNVADQFGNRVVDQATGVFVTPIQLESKYLSSSAGVAYFDKPFPTNAATKFNFYLSAGVHYDFEDMRIGLEYVHISNGFTGTINPGADLPTISFEVGL